VVIISTANGLKFTEFKVKYHTGEIDGTNDDFRGKILNIPADTGKVKEIIHKILK